MGDPGGDPGLAHAAGDQRGIRAGGADARDHGLVPRRGQAFGEEQPGVAGDVRGGQRRGHEQHHVTDGGDGDHGAWQPPQVERRGVSRVVEVEHHR